MPSIQDLAVSLDSSGDIGLFEILLFFLGQLLASGAQRLIHSNDEKC